MRRKMGPATWILLLALVPGSGGCVDAFVEGLARGFADGVAVVVEEFIAQLPGALESNPDD